ncbi:MAG TPA: ABC transporter ATP-binding protein [Cellulomonas sp.]
MLAASSLIWEPQPGTRVLDEIDLDVGAGEFLAIMGSSGAGKSSLLYCLSALDRPSSGEIRLDARPIHDLSELELSSVRRANGFVFQQINLLPHLTLRENVALVGLLASGREVRADAFARAGRLLERVGLAEVCDRRPSQASGGEQQRAAVARALMSSPRVLFADEPTGALNSSSSREVLDLFDEVNRSGQTMVMVTHDPKAAARAGRVIYLADGRIRGEMRPVREPGPEREAELIAWLASMGW